MEIDARMGTSKNRVKFQISQSAKGACSFNGKNNNIYMMYGTWYLTDAEAVGLHHRGVRIISTRTPFCIERKYI